MEIRNGRAWLKVWVDGKVTKLTGSAGKVFSPGKVLTFTARRSIEVRTGKSNATYFTFNGKDLGRLSSKGNPETWKFEQSGKPTRTERS